MRDVLGIVYLVGAGPGAADLITVRGYRLVMGCDALVYDHLVDASLVEECPAKTKIYVGKEPGKHAMLQSQINEVLIDLATRPDGPSRIVRLKGGDPYVFGRGGEEATACAERGIPCSVVPGVTAGVAAPAAVGVPVTHRELTRGVTFVSGHYRAGALDLPWKELASSGLTLVFFMGMASLRRIAEELISHGQDPLTPVVVIQEATTQRQRHVVADLASVARVVRECGMRAPSVLVVGEVAGLALRLGCGFG
ncbi:MAG: uroporphyrinogen-III C-methyltransferase [Polyangiaceae bacterium]|nr:uroporphyrinogen-III C-methyltransferase [Polyangiaceae bacterium]